MASFSLHFLLIFFTLFSTITASESEATRAFRPSAFALQVQKDGATSLHVTKINKRTPSLQVPLVVDLNGQLLWMNCEKNLLSSTYLAPRCRSTQCSRAKSPYCHICSSKAQPGCHNNTCAVVAVHPVTQRTAIGELAQDLLSIQSIQGSRPGPLATIPNFLFACAPPSLLQKGLPKGVQGVVGLGHSNIALPNQVASYFGIQPTFAMCLSPSGINGVIFIGKGPYNMFPGIDVSQNLGYTPLIISPKGEYYIQVSNIKVNEKVVPIDTSLLTFNKRGFGGTMICNTSPYTILEHSIFKAFTQFYANQLSKVPQVQPVVPFGLCFNSQHISQTRVGFGVPNVDLVLHNQNTIWRIFGANSMVEARPGVLCLAFVDGGSNPKAAIVIGSYQLENNLVQFDLAESRLGYSSSLLLKKTTCGNFNFTSTA